MRTLVAPGDGQTVRSLPCPQVRFLEEAFTVTEDGRLPFPELVFNTHKKSGLMGFGTRPLLAPGDTEALHHTCRCYSATTQV